MAGRKYVKKTTVKKYVKKAPKKGTGLSGELARLKRQVSALTAVAVNRIMYSGTDNYQTATVAGTASYAATPLTRFSAWTRVFGTDADDETQKKCVIRKLSGRWTFASNEPDNRQFSMFVVSLKDEASGLLNSDGTLAALAQGTHYSDPLGTGAGALLNLKLFNVHYHKSWTAGVTPEVKAAVNPAGAVQNIGMTPGATHRFGKFNIRLPRGGIRVLNPTGDWKAGLFPKDPSKNYYVLTFWSGDSSVDLETGNMLINWLAGVDAST